MHGIATASFTDLPFAVPVRLDKIGRRLRKPPEFTRDQLDHIRIYYETTPPDLFDQAALARSLGKSRQNVARIARKMGLTRQGRPHRKDRIYEGRPCTAAKGVPKWNDKPHPRGMAGKHHSAATKAALSITSKRTWATQKTFGGPLVSEEATLRRSAAMRAHQAARPAHVNYSNRKSGQRADLGGQFFRSSWEANYARYLNFLIKIGVVEDWKYEPVTFWFEGIRRGVTSYRPDFRVKFKDEETPGYVEIKGWIVPKDHTKWARMKKYHPTVKLVIVKPKEYYAIQKKWASCLPEWEFPKQRTRWARGASG